MTTENLLTNLKYFEDYNSSAEDIVDKFLDKNPDKYECVYFVEGDWIDDGKFSSLSGCVVTLKDKESNIKYEIVISQIRCGSYYDGYDYEYTNFSGLKNKLEYVNDTNGIDQLLMPTEQDYFKTYKEKVFVEKVEWALRDTNLNLEEAREINEMLLLGVVE